MFDHKDDEILHELREISGTLKRLEIQMALDFSKLQAADAALAAEVATLTQTITDKSAKIQAALDALSGATGSDPANQALIDQATTDIGASTATLTGAVSGVSGLPTAPTPPATGQ